MGFLDSSAIPEHIAKMMRPEDRRALGKGAITRDEAIAKTEIRLERELQKQLLAILEGHRGVVVIYSRTDRKATTPLGTPDLLFAVRTSAGVFACAWELKVGENDRSPDQVTMAGALTKHPNAWRYALIRSVDEALAELRAIGL
jgi:hypothetical protein